MLISVDVHLLHHCTRRHAVRNATEMHMHTGLTYMVWCAGEVSQQVQHVVDSALPLMIKAFDTDDDKEAVTAAVLGCGVILSGAGPQACQQYMEPLATGASMVRTLLLNSFLVLFLIPVVPGGDKSVLLY